MSNVVRYFETEDGAQRRLVEHRRRKKKSTGDGRYDYTYETVRRWLTVEEYDGSSWNKVEELGDYVEPKDAPHK